MYLPALLHVARSFDISKEVAQLTLNVWFVGASALQLFLGPITLKYGKKRMLLMGIVIFSITCFICALTKEIEVYLMTRFIQGTSVSYVFVCGYSLIHEKLERKQAVELIAMLGVFTLLSPAVAPVVGAKILAYFNWEILFVILGIWSVIGLCGVFTFMPNDDEISKKKIEILPSIKIYCRILRNLEYVKNASVYALGAVPTFVWLTSGAYVVMVRYGKNEEFFGYVNAAIFIALSLGSLTTKMLTQFKLNVNVVLVGFSIAFISSVLGLFISYVTEDIFWNIFPFMMFLYGVVIPGPILNRNAMEASDESSNMKMSLFSIIFGISAIIGSSVAILLDVSNFSQIASLMLVQIIIMIIIYNYRSSSSSRI